MRQEFFKNLAKDENGKFYHSDEDLAIGFGVRSPDEITKVIFEYNDSHFQVANKGYLYQPHSLAKIKIPPEFLQI